MGNSPGQAQRSCPCPLGDLVLLHDGQPSPLGQVFGKHVAAMEVHALVQVRGNGGKAWFLVPLLQRCYCEDCVAGRDAAGACINADSAILHLSACCFVKVHCDRRLARVAAIPVKEERAAVNHLRDCCCPLSHPASSNSG